MKVLAARAVRDAQNVQFLITHLGITAAQEVWGIVNRFFPEAEILPRSRALVEDVLAR